MRKNEPLHRIEDQAVLADDVNELLKPDTIIWAKLRGYPWWPGRVKSFSQAPRELAHIAKTQYKPGTVAAVYFFGSHDFSLVPVEALRPFEPNYSLFSSRSVGTRFTKALMEAREPEKYSSHERIRNEEASADSPPVRRKRGRPPKNKSIEGEPVPSPPALLRLKGRPRRYDALGKVTRSHVLYCRIKLQKILLRPETKLSEVPIAERILSVLEEDPVSLEILEKTKIARVLRLATFRSGFASGGGYARLGPRIGSLLGKWRHAVEETLRNVGL